MALLKDPLQRREDQRQWQKCIQEAVGPLVPQGILSQRTVPLCPGEPEGTMS